MLLSVMEVTGLKNTNKSQPVHVGLNPNNSHVDLGKQKLIQQQDDSAQSGFEINLLQRGICEIALITTKGKTPLFNKLCCAVGATYFMSASIRDTVCINTGVYKEK